MAKILFSLILLFSFSVSAKSFLLVVEKRSVVGVEQTSFMLENNSLRLVQNSNFLSDTFPIYLGIFRISASPQILSTISKFQSSSIKTSAPQNHEVVVVLNGKVIDEKSKLHSEALGWARFLLKRKDWKLEQGQIVDKNNFNNLVCNRVVSETCISKYGSIHLK
jgi:hypothetical protein